LCWHVDCLQTGWTTDCVDFERNILHIEKSLKKDG
jgi:hypothetical protein